MNTDHVDRYAAFRDLAKAKLPNDRQVVAHVVVFVDDKGELYSGCDDARQCLPELASILRRYDKHG
ncbi:MAG: hypothetical protein NUV80_06085 [Candidatus Berkelbacteria bacterium]|nr:hypothetical protein [Candidatus Berkelbacteria bacterium]